MVKVIIFSLILLLVTSLCTYAQNVVQVATTRDSTGHWDNWVAQEVTWDNTIVPDVPDHLPMSYKALQTWSFPVEGGWIKARFTRNILGVYALRWSVDNGEIWSEPESVIILRPPRGRSN